MKKNCIILLTLIMTISFNYGSDKSTDINKILLDVSDSNNINIIIKFDVPDIYILTEQSRKFNSGVTDRIKKEDIKNIDRKLEKAINSSANEVLHSLNNNNYTKKYIYKTIPYLALNVDLDTLKHLEQIKQVKRIYLDKPIPLPESKIDIEDEIDDLSKPMLNDSIGIIGADTAWGFGLTGKDWYVAILDTGIRSTHEMFSGKNIIEQCYSYEKDCPNGKAEMSGAGSAAHYDNQFDHGSHVTGIAVGNNHKDMYGVAKDSNIIAVQVFSYISSWDDVGSYNSDQLKGLEFVYSLRGTYNIASANMSLGGEDPHSTFCDDNVLKPVIDNLKAVGIATVIASGNEGYCDALSSPACISSSISVDGSSKYDQEYSFGNWQDKMLDLIAPGTSIKSVVGRDDSSYGTYSGTSMAAPHVAGAWAILKQHNPNFTVDEILSKLIEGGVSMNQKSSCGNFSTQKPRIDLDTTVSKLFSILPPESLTIEKEINRSLLQTEVVNSLIWTANPKNAENDVVSYKIYKVESDNLIHLSTLNADQFNYNHRNVGNYTEIFYAITAVNGKGEESIPYYASITF